MNKVDFEYDYDQFGNFLSRAGYNFSRASTRFNDYVECWRDIDKKLLGGEISFELVEDHRYSGRVLGQQFFIDLYPFIRDEKGMAEAVISVKDRLNGDKVTIDTFLVNNDAVILSPEGEELSQINDDLAAYRLLIAIVRKVLLPRQAQETDR